MFARPRRPDNASSSPTTIAITSISITSTRHLGAHGLEVFRHRGVRGPCAGRHAPDGVELACVGWSDEDLRRRALDRVDEAQAEALVRSSRVTCRCPSARRAPTLREAPAR
jgi:hypothetical protein